MTGQAQRHKHAGRWQEQAACTGRGEEMFPDPSDKDAVARARQLCFACPVRHDCLVYALQQEGAAPTKFRHGIYGGTKPSQRTALRREWERQNGIQTAGSVAADLKPCGTTAAARRHRRRDEELCGPCADAERLAPRGPAKAAA